MIYVIQFMIFKNLSLYLLFQLLLLISHSSFNLCIPDAILQTGDYYARSVHFSPDHSYLVVGSHDNSAYVFKFNGTIFQLNQTLPQPNGNVVAVSINHDHTVIALGSLDTNTYIYSRQQDQAQFSLSQTLDHDGIMIFSISLSKSGQFLASGGASGRTKVYQRNKRQFKLIETIQRPVEATGSVEAVSFSEDGTCLSIGYHSGGVAIYHLNGQTYQQEQVITTISTQITSLSLVAGRMVVDGPLGEANDQHFLVAASQNITYIFAHVNGLYVLNQTLAENEQRIWNVVLEPHKKYIATASGDNSTYIYSRNSTTGQYQLYQVLEDAEDFCLGVAFDEAAEYLAVASADSFVRVYHSLRIYEYEDREHVFVETGESLIGIGILIGIIIGIVATLIGMFLYFKFRKPQDSGGEEVISEATFNDKKEIKHDKDLEEKVYEEKAEDNNEGNEDGTVEENLEMSKVEESKKIQLFRMDQ